MGNQYSGALVHAVFVTAVLGLSAVVLHEMGHFFAGSLAGCSNLEIKLLSSELDTYTQMVCPARLDYVQNSFLLLSGSLLVMPVAASMLLLRNYEKYYSLVMIGINVIMSSFDFYALHALLPYFTVVAGAAIVIYGEHLVTDMYIKQVEINEKFLIR